MSNFINELWESIFTPGPTPTLLIATNATFASLQIVLLVLLLATYSIHFVILSFICAGLWYSINWFAVEVIRAQKEQGQEQQRKSRTKKERSPDPAGGSDTETETMSPSQSQQLSSPKSAQQQEQRKEQVSSGGTSTSFLKPGHDRPDDIVNSTSHRRRSLGESSGYISTDSEWEKVSSGEEKNS